MAWWGSQLRHDATLKSIEVMKQKYPNITIKPEYSSYDTYFGKITTQIAGGDALDIIQLDLAWMDSFTSTNVLLDLTPYVKDKTLKTEKIDTAGIDPPYPIGYAEVEKKQGKVLHLVKHPLKVQLINL